MELYIGPFHWTNETANSYSKLSSKNSKSYFTCIKGQPINSDIPDECWAITNKFDPAVIAEQQNSE